MRSEYEDEVERYWRERLEAVRLLAQEARAIIGELPLYYKEEQ